MIVHFKGTRGSLPIAHTSQDSTEKIVGALLEARGHNLRSESQVREFVKDNLPFHKGSTFGGNPLAMSVATVVLDYILNGKV